MAAGHVYHWKHGWIPLTHFAALQKAHGSAAGAARYLHSSHAIHGSHSPGEYRGGVHSGMAAARTYGTLSRQGLGIGSKVYWVHPGTGKQTEARIVGIEHTGHIIVQHSGDRNALIGHTTYSATPHKDIPIHGPFATAASGPFHNPHSHTRVIEQDAHGNPVYPKGYKPRANRPAPTRGRTVYEKTFPTNTHEHAPRVDAPPDLTPPTPKFAPLPNEFKPLDPATITAYHTISAKARLNERTKIKQAFQLGHHKVLIQSQLTKAQTEGLLNDIKDSLHQAHPIIGDRPVTFVVPTSDPLFRTTSKGTVLGYVVQGGSTVHIHPKVASGEKQAGAAGNASFMPAANAVSTRRYTITHELGHVVDGMKSQTYRAGQFHEGIQHFHTSRPNLSKYGSHSVQEGYAEAFAQHQLGGAHHGRSHSIANEYARIYGWQKAGTS